MNWKKYVVSQFTQKQHPQLTLGIRQKPTEQIPVNSPLIYIYIRAEIKILKQMVEIIHNNSQIWLECSVNLSASKVVLKEQILFFNEDAGNFEKINKFQEDVDFKKMQGESNYKISVEKTKIIRKHYQTTQKLTAQKRGLQMQMTNLKKQNNRISLQNQIKQKQKETLDKAFFNKNEIQKKLAESQSKLKDSIAERNNLLKVIQLLKDKYTKLSTQLDENVLKKDYNYIESQLQRERQAKQNLFSKCIILQRQLQEYKKK